MALVWKRPLALTLLLALVLPALAACGGATAAPPAATAVPATAVPAATEAPAADEAPAAAEGTALPEVDPAAVSGNIITAGSSTVFPLTQRMAERFNDEGFAGEITIDSIGSGAGFERFCVAGETDIANASRPIDREEIDACGRLSPPRTPIEFRVGTDALAVVVSVENEFLTDISLEDLARVFNGEVRAWSELDPSYPAEPIQLFSPGSDSGTYDYFVEEVLGDDDTRLQASGAQFSENDNVLVQGVEASPYAIGYFGYAYYAENRDRLRALSIEGVVPSQENVDAGAYPLARPLFIYSDATIMREKPQVAAFINFYLSFVNEEIVDVGYFPAPAADLDAAKSAWLAAVGQ
ncbi:MAG: PstS family phosphate ABC transporter substrate-binding protein [Chloroflexota bacterium]|nr:MAG: phosphate-binding protein [Chloroflexota bacterium]